MSRYGTARKKVLNIQVIVSPLYDTQEEEGSVKNSEVELVHTS